MELRLGYHHLLHKSRFPRLKQVDMQSDSVNLEIDDYFLVPTVEKLITTNDYAVVESDVCLDEISDNCPNLRKLYTGL